MLVGGDGDSTIQIAEEVNKRLVFHAALLCYASSFPTAKLLIVVGRIQYFGPSRSYWWTEKWAARKTHYHYTTLDGE